MALTVLYTTVTADSKVRKQQQHLMSILDAKKIPYTKVDVADPECGEIKGRLEEKAKKQKSDRLVMPQLFRGDEYLGGYDKFDNAVEEEALKEFLGLDDAPSQQQQQS